MSDQPEAETSTLQQTILLLNFRVFHVESSGQSFASSKLGAVCSKHNVPCLCYCHTADAPRHMAGVCENVFPARGTPHDTDGTQGIKSS